MKTSHSQTTAPPAARILVVDDTPENVDVLAGVLSPFYSVKVALSGEKALRIAQSDVPPELILLDVMMPEMDGYEVCRRLKANPVTSDIPIIFVTARAEVEDESRGFELGAVDYLTKPVCPELVLARVRTHVSLKQSLTRLEHLSAQLGRYVSPQIYESLIHGRTQARIETARKKLTVFFSDIVGFSAQTDILEPEDLHHVLNSYLDRMSRLVLKYGGTLDKFMGDAILSFFGDPESRGLREDALNCVRMALEMRGAIASLRQDWIAQGITAPFEVRMGISTGFCMVGNFGCEQHMAYTVIGNQVNLASRLQSSAAPRQILISADTWALVNDVVSGRAIEPIRIKGFDQPVQAYEVFGLKDPAANHDAVAISGAGFSLDVNPSAISEADRAALLEKLEAAAALLRSKKSLHQP